MWGMNGNAARIKDFAKLRYVSEFSSGDVVDTKSEPILANVAAFLMVAALPFR